MLDFVIFAVTFVVVLLAAVIYLYPVSSKAKSDLQNMKYLLCLWICDDTV